MDHRSFGLVFGGCGSALSQLGLFWAAPVFGAALAGYAYPRLCGEKT